MPPRDAFFTVMENVFRSPAPGSAERTVEEGDRIEALLAGVPMGNLAVADGPEHLPAVATALLDTLARG
jgi:hypothetical protein